MKKKLLLALPVVLVGAMTVFALSSNFDAPKQVTQAIFGSQASCSSSLTAAQVASGCSSEKQAAVTAVADGCCPVKAAAQTAALAAEKAGVCSANAAVQTAAVEKTGACSSSAAVQTAAYVEGSAEEFAAMTTAGGCSTKTSCSAEAKQVAAKDCSDCTKCDKPYDQAKTAVQTADAGETTQVVTAQE